MKKRALHLSAFALAALMLLLPAGCAKNGDTAVYTAGLCVGVEGAEFSEAFTRTMNPIYAENEDEFALGTLIAPTVMRYDPEKGWQKQLGTIEVSEQDGVTVAKITLDTSIKYSNGRKISVTAYEEMLKRIVNYSYTGYYRDYYKNPIEGLVATRYNYKGLTLEDIPDFDAQVDAQMKDLDQKKYKQLLIDTEIAGLYTSQQNPESIAPDGRSFREFVLAESRSREVKEPDFFTSPNIASRMTAQLAEIYAQKPREEWMLDEVRDALLLQLQNEFKEQFHSTTPSTPISGYKQGSGYYTDNCTVTFTKIVDRDEAIAMLNLPIIYSSASAGKTVEGAGEYVFESTRDGNDGRIVTLTNSGSSLSVIGIDRENVAATMKLRQISLAILRSEPDAAMKAEIETNGFALKKINGSYAGYDKQAVNDALLAKLNAFFR